MSKTNCAMEAFVRRLSLLQKQTALAVADHQMWSALNQQLRHAPWIGEPGNLFQWLTRSHFDSLSLAIRRIFTGKHGLIELLDSIRVGRVEITREHFVGVMCRQPDDTQFWIDYANESFDEMCGAGAREYSPLFARYHSVLLSKAYQRLRPWVDKRLAHYDQGAEPPSPTIWQVRVALRFAIRIQKRYWLLTTAEGVLLDQVMISADWQAPLRVPWFPSEYDRGMLVPIDPTQPRWKRRHPPPGYSLEVEVRTKAVQGDA